MTSKPTKSVSGKPSEGSVRTLIKENSGESGVVEPLQNGGSRSSSIPNGDSKKIVSTPTTPSMQPVSSSMSLPPPHSPKPGRAKAGHNEIKAHAQTSYKEAQPSSTYKEVQEKLQEDIAVIMKKLSEDMRQDVREELRRFNTEPVQVKRLSHISADQSPRRYDSKATLQLEAQDPPRHDWAKKRVTSNVDHITMLLDQAPVKPLKKQTSKTFGIPVEQDVAACTVSGDLASRANKLESRQASPRDLAARPSSRNATIEDPMKEPLFLASSMPEELAEDDDENTELMPGDGTTPLSLQARCEKLVTSKQMQTVVALLVLLNSITMGIQTEYQANHFDDVQPSIFHTMDCVYCVLFMIELALRMFAYGFTFFSTPDWAWNVFDTFIISLTAADLITTMSQGGEKSKSGISSQVSVLRTLRVLRVIRAIRIVRVLRFVEELRTIVVCILGSMRSLGWTLLLLFMLIYVAGICVTQIILEQRMDRPAVSNELLYWFGSLSRTCLTLYQAITSGANWDDPLAALMLDIGPGFVVFWIFYIAFTVFAMLNVVTGVFVEKAMEFAQRDKEEFMMNHICDIFRRTDNGKIGKISWNQFEKSLETEEMQEYFKSIDVDISEAKGLFDLLDVDRNGMIDAVEFVSGCVRLTGHAKALDLALVLHESRAMRTSVVSELKSIKFILNDLQLA